MDASLKRHPKVIAAGTASRSREQARQVLKASDMQEEASKDAVHASYEQSPLYINEQQLKELRERPPVSFIVRNAGKEEQVQKAAPTKKAAASRQSWHSPLHVPLAHRKLVQAPSIFGDDPPFRPIAPRPPGPGPGNAGNGRREAGMKPAKLAPIPDYRDQLSDRAFVQTLRERNKELFDRLVRRFAKLRRAATREGDADEDGNNKSTAAQSFGVEDAILFFLDAKHKYDVLYFRRKTAGVVRPAETAKLSLGFSTAPASTGRYLPYDLERIEEMPRSGAGDFFMMTSASLIHHSNNNDNDTSGEVIPLSQWIMESKMFSLLLAGIPLFQKFLVRKVFVGWVRAIRQIIYRDNCKRIAQQLPFARHAFARPMLRSCRALRDIQEIRSLALPRSHPATDLASVKEHQKELLTTAETKLIDAKEQLLGLMEEMVQSISDDLEPPTSLDELYNAEAASIRAINAKWKSAPIAAIRQRKSDLKRQKTTAALDMALVEAYIRMMDYMFTESLYLMIIGCVQHLRTELHADDNLGAICAAVTIVGDSLELSPSLEQTKHVFLDGLARLIRLVSNFHFTKNAITWSNNRGTGVLAIVAESFASSDTFSTEFDLQSVLRKDPVFDEVTKELVRDLALWFDRAAQQMLAFESLRLIYVEVQSVRNYNQQRDAPSTVDSPLSYPTANISRLTGIPGGELSRYLKSVAQRLNVLDRSNHSCQKLQTSWKVGFLEIQCRRSIAEIMEIITQERNALHQTLYLLAIDGVTECIGALQRAAVVLEDRPQLIEFFCEQMKQVRQLKEGEKLLSQNIRNVDEAVRSLKRFAPHLGSEIAAQYNAMHQCMNKYTTLGLSHAKFAAKVLPSITYQVNTALQKYALRCQKLLRMYDEFSDMEEEEDMEKNVGTFQEIVRELAAIEKATKLYQEYQKMVGLKVVEIPSLAEAMTKWGEVQDLVNFTIQWLSTINSMENGIFGEQNWEAHAEKVRGFLPVIRELQSRGQAGFAEKMLENIHQSVLDYLRKLSLVKEMAQPWVKLQHWKDILRLLDILNYVSSIGVLITDGSTVTLGFLRSRDLWKYEMQVREITRKAHHDAVTEKKLNAMKARLQDAALPILRVHDSYELDLPRASQLLESFEDDLLTIQSLAQVTASGALQLQLIQWRDEVHHCEEVLDKWSSVQRSRTKLSLLFGLRDVHQSVGEAAFEFQAIDRKWKGMMHAAKGTASLSICLHEVVTVGFLDGAQESYAKLWSLLGTYLDDKRKYFPRFNFLSDHDLFQLLIYARDPKHLPQIISKCFREIRSLRLVAARRSVVTSDTVLDSVTPLDDNKPGDEQYRADALPFSHLNGVVDIDAIYGAAPGDELHVRPLRVHANPQMWMKEFEERVRLAMIEAVSSAMDGSLVALFEDNLESLMKPRGGSREKSKPLPREEALEKDGSDSFLLAEDETRANVTYTRGWKDYPVQVILLCTHILVTHELSPLVRLDRTGATWQRFWHLFQQKKANLTEFIVHRNSNSRERWVASSMLTLLLNKSQGIRDLYEDQPLTVLSQSVGAATTQSTSDVSAYPYSYAAGDSFTWTKLPRFYYDPFEKRVTVHHLVKTFQYEYSFLGNYSCPVLSPLCKRAIMAMSTALSLEHGILLHSSSSGGCTRKRTLLHELSAMVGRECLVFTFSNGLTPTHFKRVLRGVLQNGSLWLSFSGLELSAMLRVFVQEINQVVDALRGHQDSLVLDGAPVDIINNELAVVVTCSLNFQSPPHQEFLLRLSSSFVPVVCPSVSPELLVEALLLANGFEDWKTLSHQLDAFFCLIMNDPVPFIRDFSLIRLRLAFAIVRNVTHRLTSNSWQSAEKYLVTAIWEELHSKVVPERRVAFLKCIRTIFPHAADLEINGFGMLALRTTLASEKATEGINEEAEATGDPTVSYDSDEEEQQQDLVTTKMKIVEAITARQLSLSEFYVRKLLELYQIVSRRVMTIVVGRGVCGKSSAISILSGIFAGNGQGKASLFSGPAVDRPIRTIRLYPEAFSLKDIYGEITGDSTWEDGYFSHFLRQNCVDTLLGDSSYTHLSESSSSIEGSSSSSSQLPRKGSFVTAVDDSTASESSHSLITASWIVFDGEMEATTLLEPIRELMEAPPKAAKKVILPNGDQLSCTGENLRIFCEVESLQQWSPACLGRCGLVYMQTELMLPYTLLIKSWLNQQQPTRKRASLAHLTKLQEPTTEFVAKLMRAHLPALLDVCKRFAAPFEFSVTHAVGNMLQIITPMVAEVAKSVVEEDSQWMEDARIIVAHAATMSLGMGLHPRGRPEFHLTALQIAPQLQDSHPVFIFDRSATLFDVGLRFHEHRVVLFSWNRGLLEASRPATRRSSFAYQTEFPRRTSAILRARGRIITTEDTEDAEAVEEVVGDISTITTPLSVIYVPTALTISCNAWLKMIALEKANAFIVGESGVGKTLVVENALRELGLHDRVSATSVQIGPRTTGSDIQRYIENGMTGKLKGAQCPGVGKRSLVLFLENINLESQSDDEAHSKCTCSAMIRQVIDGKGSFSRSTKEFVEFRDLALWCSFSLSLFGYPRTPSRLLRHFHMIWLPDQTDQVFAQVIPTFTTCFRRHYEGSFGDLSSVVKRLGQFPIQMFKRARKTWKPSALSPTVQFNLGSVLSVLISLMNVSVMRTPTDPVVEFEQLSMHFTIQLFQNRLLEETDRESLRSSAFRVAKKLKFTFQSLEYLQSPGGCLFADCGDTDGVTRVSVRDITAIFTAGEERFYWYHKATFKSTAPTTETTLTGSDVQVEKERSPRRGMKSVRHLLLAAGPSNIAGGPTNPPTSAQDAAAIRRSSLAMAAMKSGPPDEKVTAAPSLCQLQNILDIYSFLQSGVRHLLLSGSDTADRRSTTMVACGTLSFQYREVCTQLRLGEFIEQVKTVVLDSGLKATQTVLYAEFEDLSPEEVALMVYLIRHDDLPPHTYSSADKVKLFGLDQTKASALVPPKTSFLQEVTSTANKGGIGKRTAVHSSSQAVAFFRENVRRSLYVVLSIGRRDKLFEFMTLHPSVYYRFVLKMFAPWQDKSAEAICNSLLQDWKPHHYASTLSDPSSALPSEISRHVLEGELRSQLSDIMTIAHRTAESMASNVSNYSRPFLTMRGRRFNAITTRLDDMLRVFKVLFEFHQKKLHSQRLDLEKALQFLARKLSQTNLRVAKEESSEVLHNDATQAVGDTVTQLAEHEAVEREARRLFLLDEERCAKIQDEIEVERASIQRELAKTLPDVQEATEALAQINKYHIVEMKSFTNPPQLVRLAMQAVCVLLEVPPTWSEALRILADIRFLERLRVFDKDHIDPVIMERVKFYVNHPDFSMENMRRASLASTTLCKWVLALVRYFDAMKRVAPTQQMLQETERQFRIVEERVQAEKKKLVDIEVHLAELRIRHAQNLQREAELQRTQETRMRWKSSVAKFGYVIKQWYDITRERLEMVEQQQFNLLCDCTIVATLVIFGAEMCHERREKMVAQCRQAIQRHFASPPNDPYPMATDIPSLVQYWVLSGEGLVTYLRRAIVDMRDDEDEAFATSLFLMDQVHQVGFKIPFLVDPLDRGTSWLKQVYRSIASSTTPFKAPVRSELNRPFGDSSGQRRDEVGNVVVLDAGDATLIRSIETCLAQSPPSMVLIENSSEGDESTIEAALELITLLKEKSSCAVYFSCRSLENAMLWLPKTWSHFTVVDFAPTARELDNNLLTQFCRSYSGSLSIQSEIDSLRTRLVAEKAREEVLFRSFMANLCAASDEADRDPNSAVGATAASMLSAWISSGTGPQGFYDEESMERISAQLNDFLVVRGGRKQIQHELRRLHSDRRRAIHFAHRTRAFIAVEERVAKLDLSLHLPIAQTLANLNHCLTLLQPQAPNAPVEPPTSETLYNFQFSTEGQRLRSLAESAITQTTVTYLQQRLAGLPTSLHRTYLFALVLVVGDIDKEDSADTFRLVNTEEMQRRMLGQLSSQSSEGGDGVTENAVKRRARAFVDEVTEMGLLAATDTVCWGNLRGPRGPLTHELFAAFLKLQRGVITHLDDATGTMRGAFREALYRDMLYNPEDWEMYLKSARGTQIRWPPWLQHHFRLLDQLHIHMSLFGAVTLNMIDDTIKTHLGDEVVSLLLDASEEGNGMVRPSLDALVNASTSSTPVLILCDASKNAVAGASSVRRCARRRGIQAEAVAFMPVGQHRRTHAAGTIWSYRDKAATNSRQQDLVARDVTALTRLREISMEPGWTIVEGAAASPSLAVTNTLRLQIARLSDVKTTNHDFRLWLVEELANAAESCGDISNHQPYRPRHLALATALRLFLEEPQTLREHYDAFLLEEKERREADKLKKRLEKELQPEQTPSRPPPLRRHASSMMTALQRSGSEQRQIRAALWLFHSIFRLHAQDTQATSIAIPVDLYVSHFELDRVIRLIQLHLHQRVVASAVTAGVTSSLVQLSAPSAAAAAEAHSRTLTELAALVYMGRQPGDVRAAQCRELLTWCLHYDTLDLHSAEQDVSLVSRVSQLREKLVTNTMAPRAGLFDQAELELLPRSLQHRKVVQRTSAVLGDIAKMYHEPAQALGNERVCIATHAATAAVALQTAQQRLEALTASFPDKMSLSSGVQHLQKQLRASMIIGWGKRKASSATLGVVPQVSTRKRPSRQAALVALQNQQAPLQEEPAAHLTQVELPAMQAYLTFIWSSVETLLFLRTDSTEILNPDVLETVEALRRGDLPVFWRGNATDSEGYPTPTRLTAWLTWFRRAVAFFQAHQHTVMSPSAPAIDSIWLPALQRPKALLSSFRHSIALRTRLPLKSISFVVLSTCSATTPSKASEPAPIATEDLLGSITLSGLLLANAAWSEDSSSLSEQLATHSQADRFQALPALQVHATSRFRLASEGLMLPSGTAGDDPRPLQNQVSSTTGFFRCPLFVSPHELATLQTPIGYVFLPVQGEQAAGVAAVQCAALFLLEQYY